MPESMEAERVFVVDVVTGSGESSVMAYTCAAVEVEDSNRFLRLRDVRFVKVTNKGPENLEGDRVTVHEGDVEVYGLPWIKRRVSKPDWWDK